MGAADLPRRPLADKFLHRVLVRVNAYKCAKFQLLSSINFRYKENVPKFNVGLLALCRTSRMLKLLCVLKVLVKVKQLAKFQHCISMHDAVMRICIFHGLSIIHCVPKKNHVTMSSTIARIVCLQQFLVHLLPRV